MHKPEPLLGSRPIGRRTKAGSTVPCTTIAWKRVQLPALGLLVCTCPTPEYFGFELHEQHTGSRRGPKD